MLKFNPIKSTYLFLVILMNFHLISCAQKPKSTTKAIDEVTVDLPKSIKTAADRTNLYTNLLQGKNIAIVANQTSVVKKNKTQFTHLVDSLLSLNINIKKVFAPEHGFRGKADAGEIVKDGIDTKTGLPIVSLYGKNKKPSQEQLQGIEIVVFDIQDVGARFYTYISSLHYVMEACAEANIPVIVLDRPNPNGHYIDGPILEKEYKSFVGMHPVPVVYGMTIGEYGQMINGQHWLANNLKCDLTVIPLQNYTHQSTYNLPIKPSPNLPNSKSINLYPSLCFFEGTNVSVGRGTELQFQIVGTPLFDKKEGFSFTPQPNFGSKYPKHQDRICYGYNLVGTKKLSQLDLTWLATFYKSYSSFKNAQRYPYKESFFNNFFTKLAGTKQLQQQIIEGKTETQIRATWKTDLEAFKKIRSKYLIYN